MNTVYSLFQNVVAENRDRTAIIENDRTMTFGELSNLTDLIAGSFPERIISVGIVMSHRAEMIAAILAVLKCGARYVPAEPNFPTGRIRYMMEEAEVDFILTETSFTDKLGGFDVRLFDCEICGLEAPASEKEDTGKPELPAYVLYTSGTTGRPKGICVTNRNVCHYVRAFANEFKPTVGDIMLQYSVCSFDIFVEEVFASLLNGAALAIPSTEDKENVKSLMNFVERHKVTMISGFPYLLAEMNHLPCIPACPGFRGHGVGEMIVRWLVGQAVQRNITKIYLETSKPGRKLYEKTGFLDMSDMMKLQIIKSDSTWG